MRTRSVLIVCFLLFSVPVESLGQDTPVVFVHGFSGDQHTWSATASRLHEQLAIRPYLAQLRWQDAFETQAAELQGEFGSLPASTVAVGHSNGGLVIRQWNFLHPLGGVLTVGTPNHGAPAVDNLHQVLQFNEGLYSAVALAGGAFSIDPSTWNFVYLWVQGALLFSQQVAIDTVLGVLGLGLQAWLPVTGQMGTGSYIVRNLNSSANIAREQSAIAGRAGLTYVARNYWQAGPMRAIDPANADRYYAQMWGAIYILESAASALAAYYPTNSTAMWIANSMFKVAGFMRWVDPAWCGIVTNDISCNTWHDGIVPLSHQVLPAAYNLTISGPAHTQEPKESGPVSYALTSFLGVAARGGSVITGGGTARSDELGPGQSLFAGQSRVSGDGRYELAFQGDGNLVLYRVADGVPLWATHTYAPDGEAAMQTDGNLVVYNASGVAVWSSGTVNYPGAHLFVQNDGNVVIYDYYGYPIWATGTTR